ncbi:MAG: ABC transporter ATP-binding protein [Clostridia bacterium]|nr:ABC transporter ATP-binding protein [Clostridia bacterium]
MNDIAIKISHVSKEYRLGMIGGATLRGELQSRFARLRGKEDPNLKIGAKAHEKNERFLALDDVSLEIKKGERVGIIGHNGAGKSTLLKLICRVTAPTKGEIYMNGRVTSMLEVGTGFHGELSGKENVYLNGAILGLSKAEIDKIYDKIVEFSEVGKFIDTPVKRYSSGMNVKLGFSVAAHLNSEIMIMDEVLAVGDMAFQKKCIERMKLAAEDEGRTILYVSHNMATVRKLCDRVIVLSHGKVIFDGPTAEGIDIYINNGRVLDDIFDYSDYIRRSWLEAENIRIQSITPFYRNTPYETVYNCGDPVQIRYILHLKQRAEKIVVLLEIIDEFDVPVGAIPLTGLSADAGTCEFNAEYDFSSLLPGKYGTRFTVYTELGINKLQMEDNVVGYSFELLSDEHSGNTLWNKSAIGSVKISEAKLKETEI